MLLYKCVNFFIGACFGSHALVILLRQSKQEYLFGFSHCDVCLFPLTLFDEIPILSFLVKKGHCSYCAQPISYLNFLVEIYGGISFLKLNFHLVSDWLAALFNFFILLIALQDKREQKFNLNCFYPLLVITIFSKNSYLFSLSFYDWFNIIFFTMLFLSLILKNKMGLGDLLLYLLFTFYFGSHLTLEIFLLACIIFIIDYLINHTSNRQAFVPYLYLGMIIIKNFHN